MVTRYFADGPKPKIAKVGDAGIDLCYCGRVPFKMEPGVLFKIPTGVFFEIPLGYCGIIFERSGLGSKHGYSIHGRVIDAGYRGEIVVIARVIQHGRIVDVGSKDFQEERPIDVLVDHEKGVYEQAVITTSKSESSSEMKTLIFKPGDRVAQMVILPHLHELVEVLKKEELSDTARGTTGLGSTGR